MQQTPATQLHKSLRSVLLAVQFAGQNLTPTQVRDAAEQAKQAALLKKTAKDVASSDKTRAKCSQPSAKRARTATPLVQAVPLHIPQDRTQQTKTAIRTNLKAKEVVLCEPSNQEAEAPRTRAQKQQPAAQHKQQSAPRTLRENTSDHQDPRVENRSQRGCREAADKRDRPQTESGSQEQMLRDDIHMRNPPPDSGGNWIPVMRARDGSERMPGSTASSVGPPSTASTVEWSSTAAWGCMAISALLWRCAT